MRTIPTLATLIALLAIGCTIKVALPGGGDDDDHHVSPDAANHEVDAGNYSYDGGGYMPADAGTWGDCDGGTEYPPDGGNNPPVDAGYYSADAEICLVLAGCHLGAAH